MLQCLFTTNYKSGIVIVWSYNEPASWWNSLASIIEVVDALARADLEGMDLGKDSYSHSNHMKNFLARFYWWRVIIVGIEIACVPRMYDTGSNFFSKIFW